MSVLLWCGLCTAITLAMPETLSGEPNQPQYLKTIPPDKIKEDLDFLFKTIEEVHPNMYAYTTKQEFEPLKKQLYKKISEPMSPLDFYKTVAPVVASLKSGHTYIQPFSDELKQFMTKGGSVFPLALRWDNLKLIISRNFSSSELPLGATLLTINSCQASEIFNEFARLVPSENKNINPAVIERPEIFGWLLYLKYGPVKSWNVEVKCADGTIGKCMLSPVPLTVITGAPVVSDDGKTKNHHKYFTEYDTVVLEINSFGSNLAKFKEFLREVFQEIHDKSLHNLIVDVRQNPGGSDMNADALLEYLTGKPYRQFEKAQIKLSSQDEQGIAPLRKQSPGLFEDKKSGDFITLELPLKTPPENPMRFEGKTFVLIGPHSFSTTTSFASTVKCFGIGKLIGEETGDPTVLYGNAIDDRLPNTGLTVAVPGRAFVLAGGKPDGHGVIPDYEVKQKPEDTAKGVDSVLQFTLDLIKQSSNKANSIPDK
ncbi:MAG: S41 family peptidase [Planctomycetota bacterium]